MCSGYTRMESFYALFGKMPIRELHIIENLQTVFIFNVCSLAIHRDKNIASVTIELRLYYLNLNLSVNM